MPLPKAPSAKTNAKRRNLTPKQQKNNGTKQQTRTSTGMVAKAPPGTVRGRRLGRARFG